MQLSRSIALDLSLIIMVASFVGSRMFHVFYENFDHYAEAPLKILYFWEGGFVYYGGAIFSALAVAIYLYFKAPKNFECYFDLFAPVMSLAYILGRSACFLAGCCYGESCELPWAVDGRHPTQLYAMIFELGTLILILGLEKTPLKSRRPQVLKKEGAVFYVWIFLHALGRLIMEQFRDDFRGANLGLSISSWISVFVMLLGFFMLVKKPIPKGK